MACHLIVDSGICGFRSVIEARKQGRDSVSIIIESECEQICELNNILGSMALIDILTAAGRNPVFARAQEARCHASCPVPVAILKCAEVELGMALPRDVSITFEA
ncbi:MAG: hypothetical protein JSV55_09590 [Deltaproteobacteria bacterium]|nr:MAG: hypothetical protein JSV55_09590 [Deltaproteobacteria bacterium]